MVGKTTGWVSVVVVLVLAVVETVKEPVSFTVLVARFVVVELKIAVKVVVEETVEVWVTSGKRALHSAPLSTCERITNGIR